MSANLLIQNINRYVQLNVEEEQFILRILTKEKYAVKTILLQPEQKADVTYFVIEGILRSYTVNDHGAEHILSFAASNWWITDMYSFFGRKPAISYIDVVEKAEVYVFHYKMMEKLFERIPKMERFFRILTQNALVSNQQRIIDNMTLTAEERYDHFLKKFPDLSNRLPQKQIASYIGVTPEFFSKMKAKKLRNG